MNEQTNPTTETISNKATQQEVNQNTNAKQTTPEESGSTSGETKSEQVEMGKNSFPPATDSFAQMYDMLKERDEAIQKLTSENNALKKQNTEMILKVNASGSSGDTTKTPYEKFVDAMVKRR